jgi:hypothetical protein
MAIDAGLVGAASDRHYERTMTSGRIIRQGVPPDDVYAQAVKDAEEWRLAGAKTAFL